MALCALFLHSRGQTLSLAYGDKPNEFKEYSTANFAAYREHGKGTGKIIAGSVIAGSGMFCMGFGALLYLLNTGDNLDRGLQNFSTGLVITGGAMVVAGSIIGIVGVTEKRSTRRWGIVAPKRNEIGLAYSFK